MIIAIVFAFDEQVDRTMTNLGISLACHARCEVKILQKRIEQIEQNVR